MILNFKKKTISFKKNKKNHGVAFDNLEGPVYIAVSG
jgi:hypothetical protein